MKQKDIALILVISFISGVLSFFVSGKLFKPNPKGESQKVEVVQKIDSDFPAPDAKYFNAKSFDPTQLIIVTGNSNNSTPFNTKPEN